MHNPEEVLGQYRIHQHSLSSASVLNGRVMAVGSQLGAVSARRRRTGQPDILFEPSAYSDLRSAETLEMMCAYAEAQLSPDEVLRFRLAVAMKLLELAAYRPFSIGQRLRVHPTLACPCASLLDRKSKAYTLARHRNGHASTPTNELANALALTPPSFYARTAAKALRGRLARLQAEGLESIILLAHELRMALSAIENSIDRLAGAALANSCKARLVEQLSQFRNRVNMPVAVFVEYVIQRLSRRYFGASVKLSDEREIARARFVRRRGAEPRQRFKIRCDDANTPSGFQDTQHLANQMAPICLREMLNQMLTQDRVERVVGQGEPPGRIHVNGSPASTCQVNIHPPLQNIVAAADVETWRAALGEILSDLCGGREAHVRGLSNRTSRLNDHAP